MVLKTSLPDKKRNGMSPFRSLGHGEERLNPGDSFILSEVEAWEGVTEISRCRSRNGRRV